ncbi:MAG: hypothetical protein AB8V19_03790 [Candidatus Midichloria sp.]|uniref:Uncharacterized protein n=1 Tax=Hyalomma marginatum TaxID=34627 RepID=A0A8S4C2V3_9ACAR|nr:hypothetical protein MHYMCMPASI_00741 [Hyalomma marginatum]CAG7594480.1 hypothetical protein MHYMCMPSP_00895 [Hyalomma marginatum]
MDKLLRKQASTEEDVKEILPLSDGALELSLHLKEKEGIYKTSS